MFALRRIVTATDANGRSVIAFDDNGTNRLRSATYPGLVMHDLWATAESPAGVSRAADRAVRPTRIEPDAGGTVFRVIELPPDHVLGAVDAAAGRAEFGLASAAEPAPRHHSMHRTATVDYLVVLSGEMWMLLDDTEVLLGAGTCVVQQATSHGFSNRSPDYCVFAAVLVDAAGERRGS